MATSKHKDNKGRILKDGESQRKDGSYRFRYTDAVGKRHDIYSNRLVSTDKTPKGCKDDLSLREKEKLINKDLNDGIKAKVENSSTLNNFFDLYMATKNNLKESVRTNYLYMYNRFVRNSLGQKRISTIKYSDIKIFYNSLISDLGLKPNSMEIIHTLLHPTFKLAVRDNCIRVNPTSDVMSEIKKEHN
jgi:predicted nucleotidyltransferase